MWKNALRCTIIILVLYPVTLFFAGHLDFLRPYRESIERHYMGWIGIHMLGLAINLFAIFLFLTRFLFMKDTGEKLTTLEEQIREGRIVLEDR